MCFVNKNYWENNWIKGIGGLWNGDSNELNCLYLINSISRSKVCFYFVVCCNLVFIVSFKKVLFMNYVWINVMF